VTARAKAVGYVRVSRVGGRGGDRFLSPELQREQIATVAAREGLEVVEVIEELDASGGDATRPGWNRAIEMVERGEVAGIAAWNYSRMSRSTVDFLTAWDRVQAAGGRLYSATEDTDDSPSGKMLRTFLLAIAEAERDRARAAFGAATASAVERGIHVAGTIPYGYRRGPDRRLVVDPDAAPLVVGLFERRAQGWSWVRLARWAAEQGHEMSDTGVRDLVRNPAYLGQARYGDTKKDDAHAAIVPKGLWRKCQSSRKPSARTGRLVGKYLLQGLATCSSCGGTLYLSGSGRRVRHPYYICRHIRCTEHAYARAKELDSFVLNKLEEAENPADPSTWVAVPGDDRDVEEAEAALEEAREDLDGFLEDTTLRRALGADKYAETVSNYVAVVNKAEADLTETRERHGGRYELVGRLWLQEWGWAERKEYLSRMIKSVVVSKGREPLSGRVEVELR
jgi:DNA invertase Pin-like site-specific DNA recombinase